MEPPLRGIWDGVVCPKCGINRGLYGYGPCKTCSPVTEDLATAGRELEMAGRIQALQYSTQPVGVSQDLLKESVAHGENLGRWLTCPRCNKTLYYTSGKPACNYGGCVNVPLDVPAHCVLTRAEADERAATLKAERQWLKQMPKVTVPISIG